MPFYFFIRIIGYIFVLSKQIIMSKFKVRLVNLENDSRIYIWESKVKSVGSFRFKNVSNDAYLYPLDNFDREYYENIKLKENEYLFRYETETTKIGGMKPIIKVNISNGLIYFLEDIYSEDDKDLQFVTRGERPLYLSINQNAIEIF